MIKATARYLAKRAKSRNFFPWGFRLSGLCRAPCLGQGDLNFFFTKQERLYRLAIRDKTKSVSSKM